MKCKVKLQITNTGGIHGILLTCKDVFFMSKVLKHADQYLTSFQVVEFGPSKEKEQPPVLIIFDFDKKRILDSPSNARGIMAQSYLPVLRAIIRYTEENSNED